MTGGIEKRYVGILFRSNGTYSEYYIEDFKEIGVR
jgi:hypothetical protein